ncbi:MAG: FAD:protein FMN transferase [Prevotella sp.]|jgi:thiamine biosynthesis lipoprotein
MEKKKNKKRIWQVSFLALLIIGTVIIIKQQRNLPYQHNEGFIFGTVYHVTYQHDRDLQKNIEAEMQKVDDALSTFNKNSIISKINQNKQVELNDMFIDIFNLSQHISKDTDGAFDITVAPMVNVWGFGFKTDTPPTKHTIDSIKTFVGYDKVSLKDGKIIKKDPRTMLDCSAIAKGYGVDVVANYLKKEGIKNFLVEIGGEIVSSGISEKRLPWKIGVTKPVDDSLKQSQELQTILNVTNMAMATSGNYRNFYYKNGKKYAHTIDPKTGYPVQHNILSATVLADHCATADAYATSFMVMGLDKTKENLKKHPELLVYIIYADDKGNNKVWYSPSMEEKIIE